MKEIETRIAKSFHQGNSKTETGEFSPIPVLKQSCKLFLADCQATHYFFPSHMKERLAFTEIHP
jgi:hypothetical protein